MTVMTRLQTETPRFTTDAERWQAVVRRDRSADGAFYYAVRTTGVYCRPSCAARLALRENVSFHAGCADAERAGFRACKRCRPNEAAANGQAAAVANACRLIETAEELPSLDQLAAAAGLSRFHFHRVFKSVTGLTPKAYAAAHRARRLVEELPRTGTVTEAIYGAGFNSSGRFYEASQDLLGMTPTRFRAGGAGTIIRFAVGQCSLGSILVAATESGVCAIMLGDDPDLLVRDLEDRFPKAKLDRRRCLVRALGRQGRRLRRGAAARPRFAARPARHRVPAARVAGAARHPARRDHDLHRDRRAPRRAECGASGGACLRLEPDRDRHSLPSRGAARRLARRLSLGHRAQARAARPRSAAMSGAVHAVRAAPSAAERVAALEWRRLAAELDERGAALLPALLEPAESATLARAYDDDARFRSRVVMARHGFGRGEYKYLAYPLPDLVEALRAALYPRLAPIANRWNAAMGVAVRYPETLAEFLERCHRAGQTKPTPLLLSYAAGDYNCLHQDLYGEHVFPLQATVLLSAPGREFAGGEFVLTEQRPRMQSRIEVVPLGQGDAVLFAVNHRPVQGTRGPYRVAMRHGVSRVVSGHRRTLGLIFHDAQ